MNRRTSHEDHHRDSTISSTNCPTTPSRVSTTTKRRVSHIQKQKQRHYQRKYHSLRTTNLPSTSTLCPTDYSTNQQSSPKSISWKRNISSCNSSTIKSRTLKSMSKLAKSTSKGKHRIGTLFFLLTCCAFVFFRLQRNLTQLDQKKNLVGRTRSQRQRHSDGEVVTHLHHHYRPPPFLLTPQRASSSGVRSPLPILSEEDRDRFKFHLRTTPVVSLENDGSGKIRQSLWNGTIRTTNDNSLGDIMSSIELYPYPHAGAVDENGNYHYHFDPSTFFSENGNFPPPPLRMTILNSSKSGETGRSYLYDVCSIPPGEGEEGPYGYQALASIRQSPSLIEAVKLASRMQSSYYIKRTSTAYSLNQGQQKSPQSALPLTVKTRTTPKILCIIYTHSNRHYQVRSVLHTWGQRCNGFLAASNLTDPSIGAVKILHHGLESDDNMWQKIRSIWAYVYDHYLNDYDYFHIGGDEMYVIVEHLREFVRSLEQTLANASLVDRASAPPLYLGEPMAFMGPHQLMKRYCGGGAGYTLNQKALSQLVTRGFIIDETLQSAMSKDADKNVAQCFYNIGTSFSTSVIKQQSPPLESSIQCANTHDSTKAIRYHQLDAQFAGDPKERKVDAGKLRIGHGITYPKRGLQSVSNTSISFHLTKKIYRKRKNLDLLQPSIQNPFRDSGMRRYHAILYRLCGDNNKRSVDSHLLSTK